MYNQSLPDVSLTACPDCDLVQRLDFRKPASLEHTAAYVLAAAICYVPANLLPVLTTTTAAGAESDTIMQGVVLSGRPPGGRSRSSSSSRAS